MGVGMWEEAGKELKGGQGEGEGREGETEGDRGTEEEGKGEWIFFKKQDLDYFLHFKDCQGIESIY